MGLEKSRFPSLREDFSGYMKDRRGNPCFHFLDRFVPRDDEQLISHHSPAYIVSKKSAKNYARMQTQRNLITSKRVEAGKNLRQGRPVFRQMALEILVISEEEDQVRQGILMRASISHR